MQKVATTTPAGRAASRSPERHDQHRRRARPEQRERQAAAKRAADALNAPQDAPLFDDAPAKKAVAPTKPARPTTLAEAAPWLLKPFAQRDIALKPTAITKDSTRALAMPYADMRAYCAQLDKIWGEETWSHAITLSERGAVCALTLFGVAKSCRRRLSARCGVREPGDQRRVAGVQARLYGVRAGALPVRFPGDMGAIRRAEESDLIDPAGVVAQMYASLPRGNDNGE